MYWATVPMITSTLAANHDHRFGARRGATGRSGHVDGWMPPRYADVGQKGAAVKFWASTAFSPIGHYVPLARAAEEAGVHGLLMSDHIFYPQKLESPYPYSPDGTPIWDPS